jgi:hypothetical protein
LKSQQNNQFGRLGSDKIDCSTHLLLGVESNSHPKSVIFF